MKIYRLSYTGIKEETAEETESEFVEVPIELKGHVIGRGGCMLQEIMRQSGARISSQSKEEKGFLVNGDKEQRAYAKKLILEKVVSHKYNGFFKNFCYTFNFYLTTVPTSKVPTQDTSNITS